MPTFEEAKRALEDAGTQLKADLWQPADHAYLEQRARDLAELAAKAAAATDAPQRAAYLAAARDTVTAVKVLAMIRVEATEQHVADALEKLFWHEIKPRLAKALPGLAGLLP
jgi:citrate synthase